MWLSPVKASIQTFKIWWVWIYTCLSATKDKPPLCKFLCLFNPPPTWSGLPHSSVSLPSACGGAFQIIPGKLGACTPTVVCGEEIRFSASVKSTVGTVDRELFVYGMVEGNAIVDGGRR